MKEIPLLFSADMVQAILAGRKTMTRRIAAVPIGDHNGIDIMDWGLSKYPYQKDGEWKYNVQTDVDTYSTHKLKCLYGRPGDLLWVRENFRVNSWMHEDGELTFRYEADGGVSRAVGFDDEKVFNKYWEQSSEDLYKGGYQPDDEGIFKGYNYKALRLRPNIFLRKEAARIWLQVTDVMIERLHNISEGDAKAEGVMPAHCETNEKCPSFLCRDGCTAKGEWWNYLEPNGEGFPAYSAKESFQTLWQSINGTDSWNANPFVWVIKFTVLSITGNPDLQNIKAI